MSAYYLILVTQTLSMVGSRMTTIAIGIWVYTFTNTATPLLLTAFFMELPGGILSSFLGVLVDRWDRRRVLVLADAGQAAGTLLLVLSIVSGRFAIWHLYTIALLQGTFDALQGPAKDAVTTVLVPPSQRERANAIQQMSFPLAGVFAPALAGGLYLLVGLPGILMIDLSTFAIAAASVLFIKIPAARRTVEGLAAQGLILRELIGGLRFLTQNSSLFGFVIYLSVINFLLNGPLGLAIPYLISVTGNEAQTGLIMATMDLGALSGAALIAVWGGTRPRIHTLLGGLLLSGLMFLVYGLGRTPWLLGACLFLLFMPLPILNTLSISILQLKTPPDMQGRIFAAVQQLGYLGSTSSFLLTGPLVDRWLEPAVGKPGWSFFHPFLGSQPGAGTGLLLVVTGMLILGTTIYAYRKPAIRLIEAILPDYEHVE